MSQKQATIRTDNSSSNIMTRKAINANGHLGSLYDGCRDHLYVQQEKNVPGQRLKSSQPAKCVVMNGNLNVSRNILQIIGVEDELQMSLLLEITQRIGIVAVLNDPDLINEHTRLLYYSWVNREEQISDKILNNLKWNELLKDASTATHAINGIRFGIDAIVILHSLSEPGLSEIDRILQKISSSLSNDTDLISLITPEENHLLSENIKITIYSNIPDLTALEDVSELLHQIDLLKKNPNLCLPITYSLQPLALLDSRHIEKNIIFHPLSAELHHKLEQYVLHRRIITTTLNSILHDDVRKFLSIYLDGRLYGANKQRLRIEKKYYDGRNRLSKSVIDFRSGHKALSDVNDALIDTERLTLNNDSDELIQNLNDLKAKAHWIGDLRNHHFSYCNAIEHDVNKDDGEETTRNKLIMNNTSVRILCSNDTLNKNNPEKLNKLLSDLTEERQKKPHLHIIYADFSYCSYKLHDMLLMSSNHRMNETDTSRQKSHSPYKTPQPSVPVLRTSRSPPSSIKTAHSSTTRSSTDGIINILLLGETGVGKSTFINALANYLAFDSLTQAQSNEPIVMIPVSFLITVGKNFEERTVEFGEMDSSDNENFNDIGQSVTQHCKSYLFDLKQNGRKLRIIDTPGFGDTRGLQQDDQNMEHILQYINDLTHLNAICFLLKPNSSRLNMFFRTCLTQLFSFLAPTVRENVIFCFTNARSTFYTPGDTAPLLKTTLANSSMSDIPFRKENTFCFDSESFRYLVALRNKITFTEEEEHEYQTSWSTSVKESKRLIDHIQANLHPYNIHRK